MAGSNMVEHKLRLLIETQLDEEQKKKVGKQLHDILGGAAIGFNEAETKKNLTPIIRMIQKLFEKAEMKFDADKLLGMPSQQALQKVADITADEFQAAFDRALAKSGGVKIDFGNIDLSGMTEPLERVAGELADINRKLANDTKKSVDEIDLAINRLNKIKPKKINTKIIEDGVEKETTQEISKVEQTVAAIERTLNAVNNPKNLTTEKGAVKALEKAATRYEESVKKGDPWEVQYQHIVDFVSKYEAITKKIKPIIDTNHSEFKELYDVLSPKAGAAKISLEHFVNVARNEELAEYKNQPWARESTLKKVEQTLKSGISVKGDARDNRDEGAHEPTKQPPPNNGVVDRNQKLNTKVPPGTGESADAKAARLAREAEERSLREAERKRLEQERIAEAERARAEQRRVAEEKAIAEARKAYAKEIYRVVYAPLDEEDLPREERKAQYGGVEIWSSSSEVANTYAEGEEEPVMLRGSISANNAYIIDANGAEWNRFDKMKVLSPTGIDSNGRVKFDEASLKSTFPDLFRRVDNKEFGQDEDIQAELYKLIKELGYDSIVTKNVVDTKNPKFYSEPSTIYAVIDDKVLNVLDAFAMEEQDDRGVTTFEDKPRRENIPEYYKMPEIADEILTQEDAFKRLVGYIGKSGKVPSEFFDGIISDSKQLDEELKQILTSLGMFDAQGGLNIKSIHDGFSNLGGAVSDAYTLISREDHYLPKTQDLMPKLLNAKEMGANVGDIVDVFEDKVTGRIYELQRTMPGAVIPDSTDVLEATDEQILKLIHDLEVLHKTGLYIDFGGDNILYDKEKGFSFIDLATKPQDGQETTDGMAQEFLRYTKSFFKDNSFSGFESKFINAANGIQEESITRKENAESITRENDALKENIDLKKQAAEVDNVLFDKTVKSLEKNNDAFYDYEEMIASSAQESIDGYRNGLDIYQRARQLIEEGYINQTTEWKDNTSKSLLPTADGLEAHTYAPSDEQKAYVLKLGEEYRAIMEILERGDSEFEAALIERANAIQHIMLETVRGNDGDLVYEYQEVYGGSNKTAVSLGDWRQSDELLRDVDSGKIDDSQRQAAIDLIYKELEAEKQLEAERLKAREAAKQRELDAFKSKYSSASEDEKRLLYEIIELETEYRNLYDIGDEESHKAAMATLEKLREKEKQLEKMNSDLFGAYDDVGAKRASTYVDAPTNVAPEVAATVDEAPINISEGQRHLGDLKASVDNVTSAIDAKTKAFDAEGIKVNEVVGGEIQKLETLETRVNGIKTSLEGLLSNIKTGADSIGAGLSNITVNVNHQNSEDVKVDTAALAEAISRIQVTPNNAELIAEIKALASGLGGVAQESTLLAIKSAIEAKDAQHSGKIPPEVKAETSTNREHRFERLNDVASMYEDVEDVEAAIKEFGKLYKEIVLIGDDATKVIKANKTGINTLSKIANENFDTSDYSWVEFKRNEAYASPNVGKNVGTVAIDEQSLRHLLDSIVYNVKIAYDDNDHNANKVTLDGATLETTLTKVFSGILNVSTEPNDSSQTGNNWALESTLQSVKGVLDNIHTNIAQIGPIEISNVDAIEGSALDSKLTEIKSVLESIHSKIASGGATATKDAVKRVRSQPIESDVKAQAARSNMMKSLINDYKTMGKLAARFAADGNLETKAVLDNLKAEISRKRQSLNITMEENKSLREKYGIAFDAEKRLLEAEKAQEEINKKNKADNDDWKKKVKDAQRSTGINAATSAANSGDQTVIRTIGTDGISQEITNKAKELSDQIVALRNLRDEISKKGEQADDADKDNLSQQISKVKELKSEIDGYLKIHEKYSGDNTTDLGDASNFGSVGTNQYWHNITAAIQDASDGKIAIKGLNAETGELTGTTKIAANTFATWSATVDPMTGRLKMLRTGIKKTETIIEQITRKTKEIFTYFSGSSIIFKAFNELKKGVQYVKEIDLALTELKKVTDETEETYDKFLDTAAKTADKVGSTIQKVVSSTADWARLGYSMKEAAEFAESTQILMNVSEFTDVSQATDTLISAVQAFGYTAETSMDVVDLLNTIGKIIAYR